jgi:hypothetical protein
MMAPVAATRSTLLFTPDFNTGENVPWSALPTAGIVPKAIDKHDHLSEDVLLLFWENVANF